MLHGTRTTNNSFRHRGGPQPRRLQDRDGFLETMALLDGTDRSEDRRDKASARDPGGGERCCQRDCTATDQVGGRSGDRDAHRGSHPTESFKLEAEGTEDEGGQEPGSETEALITIVGIPPLICSV